MLETTYYPYRGSGQIYSRSAGSAAGLIEMGNASKLDIEVKEQKENLQNYTKLGGGIYASSSRIESVMCSMSLYDMNRSNVTRALFGTSSVVEAGNAVDEAVIAYKNALVPLDNPGPTLAVVTNTGASTTYVKDVDYELRPSGLFIPKDSAITDGQALKVDYSYVGYANIEALTTGPVILELHFDGLNEANSGKPVIVDIWRIQLSPTKALSLLGDKFQPLDVTSDVLYDSSKTGDGISPYFRVRLT